MYDTYTFDIIWRRVITIIYIRVYNITLKKKKIFRFRFLSITEVSVTVQISNISKVPVPEQFVFNLVLISDKYGHVGQVNLSHTSKTMSMRATINKSKV